ncbi:MAG TPA: FxsB family cyclophane-forming radical SAM/SPASM peptide maturase [Streptosporangiaceae bacterium]|jgi:uncharacterized protein
MSRPSAPVVESVRVTLGQFVLKVHSRCDLACDHCYVYEAADQSWRGRPMTISDEVIARTAQRIAEHARSHRLPVVQVVLHGGEPLLAGRSRLRRVVTELEAALRGVCCLDLRIHTNGVLLDEGFCELFAEHGVRVGISLDGDRIANDRHRRYADGRSSYDKVTRAIGLLRTGRFRKIYAGLLCTIDVANDPLVVYESLMRLDPPRIDFLLPHATWDHPPVRAVPDDTGYADWLIAIFERWLAEGRTSRIRTFDSILSTLAGGKSFTEALGLEPTGLVVIETDGSYEQVDSLKAAFDGAPQTGSNVFDDTVDVVARHPGIVARQQGAAGLCQTCQECPVVASCGGGLYTHRHRSSNGFANPSVYCADLLKLISHISRRLAEEPAGIPGAATHDISGTDLRALAAGFGDATAMASLIEAQRSLLRALLGAVYQAGIAAPAISAPARAQLGAAWSVLSAVDRENPKSVDAVFRHPYIRAWAVRCLEQLRPASSRPGHADQALSADSLAADLGHLDAIAAAAAVVSGTRATLIVPVTDGAVHLPTLGRLVVCLDQADQPPGEARQTATVDVNGDVVSIRIGESRWVLAAMDLLSGTDSPLDTGASDRSAEWQPVRVLSAPGIRVALEDTDPYRDCHQWRALPRLSDAAFAQWQRQFRAAWQVIEREHAAYASAMGAGLTTLMPLAAAPEGRDVSAAARHAFGAVAAALPDDPVTLALLLIHEFQHVKLGAVLDLYDLYDPTDDRLFHAPWRADKRPLEGLLQGTYAHLAVTDFWRARQHVTAGPAAAAAGQRFVQWRAHTCDAVETLANSGSLTPLGAWFIDEMRHSVRL